MSQNDIAPHLTQVSTCIEWLNENTRLWSPFPRVQRMEALDLKNTLGRDMAALRLQTNGTYHLVVLQSQFDVTIGCPMRFGQFPFDEHVCDFGIEMADVSINFKEAVLVNEFPSEQAYNFSVGSFYHTLCYFFHQIEARQVKEITNWNGKRRFLATFDIRMVRYWSKYIYLYLVPAGFRIKNTNRDAGSTALYIAHTVYTVPTVFTFYIVHIVNAVQTALHCLKSSMYAYMYCYNVRALLDLGFICISEQNVGVEWTGWVKPL